MQDGLATPSQRHAADRSQGHMFRRRLIGFPSYWSSYLCCGLSRWALIWVGVFLDLPVTPSVARSPLSCWVAAENPCWVSMNETFCPFCFAVPDCLNYCISFPDPAVAWSRLISCLSDLLRVSSSRLVSSLIGIRRQPENPSP